MGGGGGGGGGKSNEFYRSISKRRLESVLGIPPWLRTGLRSHRVGYKTVRHVHATYQPSFADRWEEDIYI